MFKTIVMSHRDVEWARQFLEPKMRSVFAYILKRNEEYKVDYLFIESPEQYAILRQTMSKGEIERVFKVDIQFTR